MPDLNIEEIVEQLIANQNGDYSTELRLLNKYIGSRDSYFFNGTAYEISSPIFNTGNPKLIKEYYSTFLSNLYPFIYPLLKKSDIPTKLLVWIVRKNIFDATTVSLEFDFSLKLMLIETIRNSIEEFVKSKFKREATIIEKIKDFDHILLNPSVSAIAESCSEDYSFKLWQIGLLSNPYLDYVIANYREFNPEDKKKIEPFLLKFQEFLKIEEYRIEDDESYAFLKKFFDACPRHRNIINSVFENIYRNCSDYYKVKLWLDNHNSSFEFAHFINHIHEFKQNKGEIIRILATLDNNQKITSYTVLLNQYIPIDNYEKYCEAKKIKGYFSSDFQFLKQYIIDNSTEYYQIYAFGDGLVDDFDWDIYRKQYNLFEFQFRKVLNKRAKAYFRGHNLASIINDAENSEILFKEDDCFLYEATWRALLFEEKAIRFHIADFLFTSRFEWEFAKSDFNYFRKYLSGKRLPRIKFRVSKDLQILWVDTSALLELYKAIRIAKIMKDINEGKERNEFTWTEALPVPINEIIRHKCVNYLGDLQNKNITPTYVAEIVAGQNGNIQIDESLLFTLLLKNNIIAVVWESTEFDKSKGTHVFKCTLEEYHSCFDEIIQCIENYRKVRSILNGSEPTDVEMQIRIKYYCRIDHPNINEEESFLIWKKRMDNTLMEMEK